jgi:hypothetical protein
MTRELLSGIYRHYKGPLYEVSGYAHDANIDGRELVLYRGLELTGAHLGPRWSVRDSEFPGGEDVDLDCFFDTVHPDGTPCRHEGNSLGWCNTAQSLTVRRFEYLGPTLDSGCCRALPSRRT